MAGETNAQREVIEFLSSPSSFKDGAQEIQVISTHGAKIFLGQSDVYKIKRNVCYDYMDFSTLESRETACRREYELNKPLAPDVYVDVIPVTRFSDGRLELGGEGEVLEWALQMRRFPEKNVLERIAEIGELHPELCTDLGKQIAEFHHNLQPLNLSNGSGRIQSIVDGLNDTLKKSQFNQYASRISELRSRLDIALTKHGASLNSRSRIGMVRRCHGDLHLRNLVMLNGIPTPFDALEFDDELATTDVLYDFAFLLMDVLHLGLRREANAILNSYVLHGWDLIKDDGFEVLPIFLSIRATIRAMVNMQRAEIEPAQLQELEGEIGKYFDQAIQFLKPNKTKLIAIGGFSGTGKSTLAAEIAPGIENCCGALLLRSDLERKKLFNVSEYERLPDKAYNQEANRQVYNQLIAKARAVLRQGQSVVLDAVFANEDERAETTTLAEKLGMPICGIWLTAPKNILVQRVRLREHDASDANEHIVTKQIADHPRFSADASPGWHEIDASGSMSDTLANAQVWIDREWGNNPQS